MAQQHISTNSRSCCKLPSKEILLSSLSHCRSLSIMFNLKYIINLLLLFLYKKTITTYIFLFIFSSWNVSPIIPCKLPLHIRGFRICGILRNVSPANNELLLFKDNSVPSARDFLFKA